MAGGNGQVPRYGATAFTIEPLGSIATGGSETTNSLAEAPVIADRIHGHQIICQAELNDYMILYHCVKTLGPAEALYHCCIVSIAGKP